jgi:pimeloyl-ACP methyl ester carboxylesterase
MTIIKGYVPFADGQLHYCHTQGQGHCPSVFLHQTASSSAMYPTVSAELASREAIDTLIAGDRWHEAYDVVFSQDFPAFLAQVSCPMLLVCGDGDVLYPYFGRAREARPDARAVELKAGAYVLDQQPDQMAELISDFFRD